MSLKKVMVSGGVIGFDTGSAISGGAFVITTLPSLKTKVDGEGVFYGPLSWTFTGGSGSGAVGGSVSGAGAISPTALYNKEDGMAVVLEGDSVASAFAGVTPGGSPISFPGVVVKVTNAGQSVLLGE